VKATCTDCGAGFDRDPREHWKVRCLSCWALAKGIRVPATTTGADSTLVELRDRLRPLLSLCHPDRHDNSQLATTTTQWLLSVRDRLQANR
jgi:hypothetical protein